MKIAAACVGKTLEEQAVGPDMSKFQNIPSVLKTKDFNQFRVLITTPDATTGATTFCGVVCLFILLNEWQLTMLVDDTRDVDVWQIRSGFVHRSVMTAELYEHVLYSECITMKKWNGHVDS